MTTLFIQTYSDRTILGILRDLRRNAMAARRGTWEAERLIAIEREARRRKLGETPDAEVAR